MGFLEKKYTLELNAYLTQTGREMLLTGDRSASIAKYFVLGDSDRNYSLIEDDRIREMVIPDITGDKTDSLYSVAEGFDIKHKVGTYKEVENSIGFQRSLATVSTPTLNGDQIRMVMSSRNEDIYDDNTTMFGNMYTSLNLPCTESQIEEFTHGSLSNTALQYLNQNRCLIIEVPKNSYGEMIDGKSIRLQLPLQNSQMIDIYSSFFEHTLVTTKGNALYSDPNTFSSTFGTTYEQRTLPGQHGLVEPINGYGSNVAYLFSDYVRKPRNNNANTWASRGTYFRGQTNVPSGKIADKFPAIYSGANMDYPVGIAYLDKGFIVITHPQILSNLSTDRITTGIVGTEIPNSNLYGLNTFHMNETVLDFSSFNTEFIQHSVCLCLPNEFYVTENPTYPTNSNRPVAVTEIGLYNASYELIAIAKPNFPIAKDKYSVLSFNINIRV